MKKSFAVLKSVLTWFLLLTYPIVLFYLFGLAGYAIMVASMAVYPI